MSTSLERAGDLRARVTAVLGDHAGLSSDEQRVGDEWAWGIHCECGEFVPDAEWNTHTADAIVTAIADQIVGEQA